MERQRLPQWLRNINIAASAAHPTRRLLRTHRLHTVCEEARCPNRGECFSRKTATFLILGQHCTRRCAFCAVTPGPLTPLDPAEPTAVAAAIGEMGLEYAVITSVTRDDLPDGGAGHFAAVIRSIRQSCAGVLVEVLVPDFQGDPAAVRTVLDAAPDVFNHNVETVPRLYSRVRPQADYQRSLQVLQQAVEQGGQILVKSGLMVGLGESTAKVHSTMADIRATGCQILTIGQYLQPTRRNLLVERYVHPDEFKQYEQSGLELGFSVVFAGPLVRSSYSAEALHQAIRR